MRKDQKKKEQNVIIGDRIRIARESAGMKQEVLAEAIGRSTQFVSDMERGVTGISIETLLKLCDVLSVSSDYILARKGLPQIAEIDPMEIVNIVTKLPSDERTVMYKTMNLLLEAFHLWEHRKDNGT